MRFAHNSTIAIKQKICKSCGKPNFIFSKGRCASCSKIEDTFARMEKISEEMIAEDGLVELIEEADSVFSKYIRLSVSDKEGYLSCFICGKKVYWKDAENMHYIKRGASLFLRFDTRNNKAGCHECNCIKGGNYLEYAKKLESLHPGLTEILYEEGNLVIKLTREEIKSIITDYSQKVKLHLNYLNKT